MKNKFYKFSALLLVAGLGLLSCDNDDFTNDSTIRLGDGAATIGAVNPYLNLSGVSTYNEGGNDSEIEFTIDIVDPLPVNSYATITVVSGGTATEDVDFSYDHTIEIPAWSKKVTSKVTIIGDNETESTESFSLMIKAADHDSQLVLNKTLEFSITDFGDLHLVFDWNRVIPGYEPLTLCDIGYDVDMYVFDEGNNDVTDFAAATVACPESLTLSLHDLPDGTYQIKENLYADAGLAGAGIVPAFKIPVTVNYTRDNSSFAGSFVQDNSDAIDSDFGNVPGFNSQMIYVATLKIENGLFTFSKNGNVIATGRLSSNFKLPNNKVRNNYFH
jgi:hypothetical protein